VRSENLFGIGIVFAGFRVALLRNARFREQFGEQRGFIRRHGSIRRAMCVVHMGVCFRVSSVSGNDSHANIPH
jgi:hypothetical protein